MRCGNDVASVTASDDEAATIAYPNNRAGEIVKADRRGAPASNGPAHRILSSGASRASRSCCSMKSSSAHHFRTGPAQRALTRSATSSAVPSRCNTSTITFAKACSSSRASRPCQTLSISLAIDQISPCALSSKLCSRRLCISVFKLHR